MEYPGTQDFLQLCAICPRSQMLAVFGRARHHLSCFKLSEPPASAGGIAPPALGCKVARVIPPANPAALTRSAMYKPNFCAQCGTKILRLRWHIWTSRKFCGDCARNLRKMRLTVPLFTSLALIASGYVVGRSRRAAPPPLTIVRRSDSPLSDSPANRNSTSATAIQSRQGSAGDSAPAPSIEEEVYLCGARTKKGTPCLRRVQAPRRCWQHKGMPAMLPQEKLLVKG